MYKIISLKIFFIDNVLQNVNSGEEVAASVLTEFRLSTGPICTTLVKTLLDNFFEYSKSLNIGDRNFLETDIIKGKIAEVRFSVLCEYGLNSYHS